MYGKVLVVAAHPDDDVLGAGALLSAITCAASFEAHTVYMSNGVGSRDDTPEGAVEKRLDAMEKANKIMGIKSWEVGLFEDQRFDAYPIIELTKFVEGFIDKLKPDTVFTHSRVDLNRDHRLTFEAVMTACRPKPDSSVKYIYSFEVPSATEWGWETFKPNVYVQGRFDMKQKAMEAYGGEIPASPHPRSVVSMWNRAASRGAECGRMAAEAFELVRMVL
jgi:LmbE family N-acetylglucosaminyl deacetylase